MAAFLGWLVATGNQVAIKNGHEGLHFPGYCSPFQTGTTFSDIAAAGGPMEQWQAVPEVGKLQIIGASACTATPADALSTQRARTALRFLTVGGRATRPAGCGCGRFFFFSRRASFLPVFIIEHQSEWKIKPHYMSGGTPGDLKGLKSFWDPVRMQL